MTFKLVYMSVGISEDEVFLSEEQRSPVIF